MAEVLDAKVYLSKAGQIVSEAWYDLLVQLPGVISGGFICLGDAYSGNRLRKE